VQEARDPHLAPAIPTKLAHGDPLAAARDKALVKKDPFFQPPVAKPPKPKLHLPPNANCRTTESELRARRNPSEDV
jgi:hypothetical protein